MLLGMPHGPSKRGIPILSSGKSGATGLGVRQ